MIQILGLRSFVNEKGETKKHDAFFDNGWRAPSVKELFQNLDAYVAKIPENERFNIYYTAANCHEEKRKFKSLGIIAFDIDHIDVDRGQEYEAPIEQTLGLTPGGYALVFSGHGLQVVIELAEPITDAQFFKDHKAHYKATCQLLAEALSAAGLPGQPDPSIFEPRRILRLPSTINRKPNLPDAMALLIKDGLTPTAFDLKAVSKIPDVSSGDQLPAEFLKRYPKVDAPAVMAGCAFLAWAKDKANDVIEPQWYAALSITARLGDDGVRLSHELSQGHKNYSEAETNLKIEQALTASGPRTCESINNLWTGCPQCPNYKKITSPILLKGEGYIKTEATGFRYVSFTDGKMKVGKPCYGDLRKAFERDHNYKVLDSSRICFVWNGSHYKQFEPPFLLEFADKRIVPESMHKDRTEFKELVLCDKLTDHKWFLDSTHRRINFQNGVLNLDTMELGPHLPDYGFRYVLDFDYDPTATCPQFEKFMDDVSCGDVAVRRLLLEFPGYCIANEEIVFHKALVLVGQGANGKSTYMNVIRGLVSKEAHTSLSLKDLQAEYNRQLLDGKLFNLSEEQPANALMDTSNFKNLVAGGEVLGRQPYKGPYTFRNRAKFMYSCNELPGSTDTSGGFFRRLLIVPFLGEFSEARGNVDRTIEKKLLTERAGIFNLLIRSYKDLMARGDFDQPQAVTDAIEAYRGDVDTVKSWIAEHVEIYINGSLGDFYTPVGSFYEAYAAQMKADGHRYWLTKQAFCKSLKKYIPAYSERYDKRKVEGVTTIVLYGVKVNGSRYEAIANLGPVVPEPAHA